jgi:hypothetical protein
MNRHIFTIRSDFMGYSQEERAMSIRHRIEAAMEKGGDDDVSFRPAPEGGRFIELNGLAVFQIRPGDLDTLTGESVDEVANNAAQNLKIAVREAREQSNTDVMLKGIRFVALASVFFFLACRIIYWLGKWTIGRLLSWMAGYEDKLAVAIKPQHAIPALIFLVRLSKWTLLIMAGYQWATISLRQFPYTRPWGEQLQSYLIDTILGILSAIAAALPNLLVVFLIILLTQLTSKMLKAFFARIESGEVTVQWMSEDTARPTRKLDSGATLGVCYCHGLSLFSRQQYRGIQGFECFSRYYAFDWGRRCCGPSG